MGEIKQKTSPNWDDIRKEFRTLDDGLYFDTASFGLMSTSVEAQPERWQASFNAKGGNKTWLNSLVESIRYKLKRHLHAPDSVLSFLPGMTYGLQSLVGSLREKKQVYILSNDYPALFFFWEKHGHQVYVSTQKADASFDYQTYFNDILAKRANVIALSHINYKTGCKVDLNRVHAFCKEHDLWLILDATQAFGQIPYDLSQSSNLIFIASCYKWTCAGRGIGVLCLPKKIHRQLDMDREHHSCSTKDSLFEISHYNYEVLMRLSVAIDQIEKIGIYAIQDRVLSLTEYFINCVNRPEVSFELIERKARSGIVTLPESPPMTEAIDKDHLRLTRIDNRCRLSFHFYNSYNDIDRLTALLVK